MPTMPATKPPKPKPPVLLPVLERARRMSLSWTPTKAKTKTKNRLGPEVDGSQLTDLLLGATTGADDGNAPPDPWKCFCIGDTVELQYLSKKPQYNGICGTIYDIEGFNPKKAQVEYDVKIIIPPTGTKGQEEKLVRVGHANINLVSVGSQ